MVETQHGCTFTSHITYVGLIAVLSSLPGVLKAQWFICNQQKSVQV